MGRPLAFALSLAALLVAAGAAAGWLATAPRRISAEVAAAVSEPGDPEAGRNVFFIAGCESCHMSPGQKDPFRLGGGMELKTPFGSFYPPNISPDPKDGIGSWSAADFANAIMAGVSPRGRASLSGVALPVLLPDVDRGPARPLRLPADGAAGLGTRAAERADLPVLDPPRRRVLEAPLHAEDRPSARRRSGRPGRARPLPGQGPGHCAECHSPRDFLGGIIAQRRLTGGPLPDRKGKAPNITAYGLKDWSEDDIVTALQTGFTPTGDVLGSAMTAVVRSLSHAPEADLAAIAHYLKTYRAGPAQH